MFTGIVTDIGRVRRIVARDATRDQRIEITTAYKTASIDLGASIACGGPCLTVVEKGADWFAVDVSAETLARTTLGTWDVGTRVNLERSLTAGSELGGHIVTGHVDAVVDILERVEEGGSVRFSIGLPRALAGYVAEKGSIALDGTSLTVNAVAADRFAVNIIPHTQEVTTLGTWRVGSQLNMEVDLLARYVERQMAARLGR